MNLFSAPEDAFPMNGMGATDDALRVIDRVQHLGNGMDRFANLGHALTGATFMVRALGSALGVAKAPGAMQTLIGLFGLTQMAGHLDGPSKDGLQSVLNGNGRFVDFAKQYAESLRRHALEAGHDVAVGLDIPSVRAPHTGLPLVT